MINAGELKHRVSIRTAVEGDQDAYGAPAITYTSVDRWANVVSSSPSERKLSETWGAQCSHVVTLRHGVTVTNRSTIVFEGRTFNVTGVLPDPDHVDLKVFCVERVA